MRNKSLLCRAEWGFDAGKHACAHVCVCMAVPQDRGREQKDKGRIKF